MMSEVQAYLNQIDPKRQADIAELHRLIRIWQPDLAVKMWRSMGQPIIGFGQASYKYSSGKEGVWFVIGLAAHKRYNSLYVWGFVDGKYLLEAYEGKLGSGKCGKACLNFRRLSDLKLDVLKEVVDLAASQNRT